MAPRFYYMLPLHLFLFLLHLEVLAGNYAWTYVFCIIRSPGVASPVSFILSLVMTCLDAAPLKTAGASLPRLKYTGGAQLRLYLEDQENKLVSITDHIRSACLVYHHQ